LPALAFNDVDRPARPDDGSPARLIATMVGIVGIVLLGSLAWSAVGALFNALGDATATFSPARPTPARLGAVVATPTVGASQGPRPVDTPVANGTGGPTRGLIPASTVVPTPLEASTATPTAATTPTPPANGRAPWILLPQPAPDSRVTPGSLTIEARGRGDAAITAIRLELDGAPLPVSLEQRSESTWRGFASAKVGAGHHTVRATVIDEAGRAGSFRWTFDAGP
jgi:hypothetical protein